MNHLNPKYLHVFLLGLLVHLVFPLRFLLNFYSNYLHVDLLNKVKKNEILLFNLVHLKFLLNNLLIQLSYPLIFKYLHLISIIDFFRIYFVILLFSFIEYLRDSSKNCLKCLVANLKLD